MKAFVAVLFSLFAASALGQEANPDPYAPSYLRRDAPATPSTPYAPNYLRRDAVADRTTRPTLLKPKVPRVQGSGSLSARRSADDPSTRRFPASDYGNPADYSVDYRPNVYANPAGRGAEVPTTASSVTQRYLKQQTTDRVAPDRSLPQRKSSSGRFNYDEGGSN